MCVCACGGGVCAGAVFPTGGIGGRLGRHSEGGAKNCAQQKKKKQKLCFFFFLTQFFLRPLLYLQPIFCHKKKFNIRVKSAKNRKRKGYVRPWCCQNMLAQRGVWLECVCSRNFEEQNNEEAKAIRGAIQKEKKGRRETCQGER